MRVMIRYSESEFGYAEYDDGVFMMGGKPHSVEDIKAAGGVVITKVDEVMEEMNRIGAPVQGANKPRIMSVSLSEATYNAVREAAKECNVKVSEIAELLFRIPIGNPEGYMRFVKACRRKGLAPEKVLMEIVEKKTAELE